MKASELEEVKAENLGLSETDGAASINAETVAKRLNELLFIVQEQEQKIDRLNRPQRRSCDCMNCIIIGT